MYEPILMSKASFEQLTEEQQQALLDAGQKAEEYFFDAAKGLDQELVQTFEQAGVERPADEPASSSRPGSMSPRTRPTRSSPRRCRAASS